jgi:hypothetical protein
VPTDEPTESLLLLLQFDTGPMAGVVHGKVPVRAD